MKESFIFLAEGFEEIEALTIVDVLRRAEMPIKIVSITNSLHVKGAHGIIVKADMIFSDANFNNALWLIAPGGMPGASNLAAFKPLGEVFKAHAVVNGNIAAICAAPAIFLAPLGILDGAEATCYPGFEDLMPNANKGIAPVIICHNIITAAGPANAMQFALAIISVSRGEAEAYDIAAGMLLYPQHHDYYF